MKKIGMFICSVLLVACGADDASISQVFEVDNPTTEEIQLTLDDVRYEIPSQSSVSVSLPAGRHTLTYQGDTISFVVNPKDQPAVINPTLTPYVLYSQIYQDDSGKDQWEEIAVNQALTEYVLEDGEIVHLPWKYTAGELFFNRYDFNWHYGINDPLPEVYWDHSDYDYIDTLGRVKLFRLADFYDYLETENVADLPESLLPEKIYTRLSELETPDFNAVIGTPLCPEVAEDLKIKINEYQAMTQNSDPKQHQALMNPYSMGYYSVHTDLFSQETYDTCKVLEGEQHFGAESGLWSIRKRVYEFIASQQKSSAFLVK